jgi:hypothetical protein
MSYLYLLTECHVQCSLLWMVCHVHSYERIVIFVSINGMPCSMSIPINGMPCSMFISINGMPCSYLLTERSLLWTVCHVDFYERNVMSNMHFYERLTKCLILRTKGHVHLYKRNVMFIEWNAMDMDGMSCLITIFKNEM